MLALAGANARLCSGCASDLTLSTDPNRVGKVGVVDDQVCFVCAAQKKHDAHLREKYKSQDSWFYGRPIYALPLIGDPPTEGGDDGAAQRIGPR